MELLGETKRFRDYEVKIISKQIEALIYQYEKWDIDKTEFYQYLNYLLNKLEWRKEKENKLKNQQNSSSSCWNSALDDTKNIYNLRKKKRRFA